MQIEKVLARFAEKEIFTQQKLKMLKKLTKQFGLWKQISSLDKVKKTTDGDAANLYDLILKRTLASQMNLQNKSGYSDNQKPKGRV